jgi:DNA replication protein
MRGRTTDDLVRIAAAGGGFLLEASGRTTDDLIRIAAAASAKRAPLRFRGMNARTTDDLVRIGAASGGCVMFE